MNKKRLVGVRGVGVALFALVAVAFVGFVVMTLWNALIPGIFAVKAISYWQALGLLVLSKLLFGGFRPHLSGPRWRRRMIDRLEQMTPEQREKFKRGMRNCGPGRSPEAEAPAQA